MADLASFESEFMNKLRRNKMIFIWEIEQIGKKHGLTQDQVERILAQAMLSGIGFADVVFVYARED